MTTDDLRVYVHIFDGKGIEQYKERFQRGLEMNATPYAFHYAEDFGVHLEFSSDTKRGFFGKVIRKLTGFDIAHAWHNIAKIRRSDAIWTMTENESLAIAALMACGLAPRKPIVSSSVWMINEWDGIPPLKRKIVGWLSKYVQIMTVQSEKCIAIGQQAFPKSDVSLMYFGINTEAFKWTPVAVEEQDGPIVLLSAGNDRTRDWKTAIDAFGGDDRFQLRIWCHWLDKRLVEGKGNIVLLENLSSQEYLEEIGKADFCLVSMHDNIFSGLTFALNTIAMGRPLICSDTGGVPTYFSPEEAFYVPVGDAQAMRDAALSADPQERYRRTANAQKAFVERGYSAKDMAEYYTKATRRLLGASARPA